MKIEKALRVTGAFISKEIRKATEPLIARIAELEARPSLETLGPFEAGKAYPRGSVVQHKSHLWVAMKETAIEPGGNQDWKLAVRGTR